MDPAYIRHIEETLKIRTVEMLPSWEDGQGYMYKALRAMREQSDDMKLLQGMRIHHGEMQVFYYTPHDRTLVLIGPNQEIHHTWEHVRVFDRRFSPAEETVFHPYYHLGDAHRVWIREGELPTSAMVVPERKVKLVRDLRDLLFDQPLRADYAGFHWSALTSELTTWIQNRMTMEDEIDGGATVNAGDDFRLFRSAYALYDTMAPVGCEMDAEAPYFTSMIGHLSALLVSVGVCPNDELARHELSYVLDQAFAEPKYQRLATLLDRALHSTDTTGGPIDHLP